MVDDDREGDQDGDDVGGGGGGKKKKKVKPGSFQGLGLGQATYKAVMKMGYRMPTPIQRKTIPHILDGQDVIAMARTGSGKTAAFLIPAIERLKQHSVAVGVRCVVLSPTRELAMQTAKFSRKLGRFSGLRCCLLVGGQAMEAQFEHLANNPDIIVATPGRLTHHMLEAELSLARVEVLIFDEADRLFELGFAEQLQKVLNACPISRQVLLFSATIPSQLVAFTRSGIKNPVIVRLDVETTLSDALELQFVYVRKDEKLAAAVSVLRRMHRDSKSTIMFVATKHHVEFFGELLPQLGLTVAMVYGNMDQTAREQQVAKFRNHKAFILVTTDVAARGIDIPLLDHVVNFDFPPSAKLFVHRTGRTARAGRSGLAVSLVTLDDLPYTVELMLFLGQKIAVCGAQRQEVDVDEEPSKKRPLLGSMPELEHEVETLERLLAEEGCILRSLHKSMMVSYGLYNKTRPSASKQSVLRAKELLAECGGPARLQGLIHPAFNDDAIAKDPSKSKGSSFGDKIVRDYVQELRGYRPKVEKIGNVISPTAMKTMERCKSDVKVVASARLELGAFDEQGLGSVLHGLRPSGAVKKRKRPTIDASDDSPAAPAKPHGARLSKQARQLLKANPRRTSGAPSDADEYDGFDVQVDGVAVSRGNISESGGGKMKQKKIRPQFFLSVQKDLKAEAKERGLDMEQYELDLMPDEEGQIKSSQSVMRWDSRKKKYLPTMVGGDGRPTKAGKKANESGKKVKGEAERSNIYQKWARTSKLRVQRPGELEEGRAIVGRRAKMKAMAAAQASTVGFDDDGSIVPPSEDRTADGRLRKPVVPFHGQIEEKYLTNKQKRMLARRAKTNRVIGGKSTRELKTPAMMQKEKKEREKNRLKQNPHLRKAKRHEAKDSRMKRAEAKSMTNGAKTRSKMLIFEGPKKWIKGKARPMTGHGRKGQFL